MNSSDQVEQPHGEPTATQTAGRGVSHLRADLFGLEPRGGDLSNGLAADRNRFSAETTPEKGVLSQQTEPSGAESRSPPRCPPRCGKQHNKGPQREKRESVARAVPSGEMRGKTGFDAPQHEWKIPFFGQDPVTGKVYFIDTSPNATNWNTTILCNRHLWHKCPFNPHHLIKTSKKFVTHIRRCINQSHLGYNGKQSQKEVKNWYWCEFNSKHRVHKDYMITHYLQNCAEMRMDLTTAWYQNKRETEV